MFHFKCHSGMKIFASLAISLSRIGSVCALGALAAHPNFIPDGNHKGPLAGYGGGRGKARTGRTSSQWLPDLVPHDTLSWVQEMGGVASSRWGVAYLCAKVNSIDWDASAAIWVNLQK